MQKLSIAVCVALALGVCGISGAEERREATPLLTRQNADGSLAGWKSFLEDSKAKTGDVWTLTADGILACKGTPTGYLYSEKSYRDFLLTLEWRTPPGAKPGKGGVLIRMTGEHKIWPKSLEAQLNAGGEGDFWGLGGYGLEGAAERMQVVEHPQFGKLTNVKRAQKAVKAPGEWNRYEILADGPKVTLKINGELVNEADRCDVASGPILLTSEGDPIEFRSIQVQPVRTQADGKKP